MADMILKQVSIDGALCNLVIENGKIAAITPYTDDCAGEDCGGAVVIPGLVDVHTHGCAGFDTMDARFEEMSAFLAQNGTTSFLPTTMTMDYDSIQRVTLASRAVSGAQILGFHMEGPYIAEKYKGAQNAKFIRNPDIAEFRSLPDMKLVTIAPELEGSMEFIEALKDETVISIGHTGADYQQTIDAIEAGAACLTHTFNAMPGIHHRNPGPIPAAAERQIYVQVISDGLHLHKSVVLMLYRLFGPDRMVLISDSMRATGLSDGQYEFGGQTIEVLDGVARTLDGAIAGSTSTLWKCVCKAVEFGIPFDDAVKMATATPAAMIGASGKGRLAVGCDADLLILDKARQLDRVMIGGRFIEKDASQIQTEIETRRKVADIASRFHTTGEFESYSQITMGNINTTYRLNYRQQDGTLKSYILQKVNTYVFKNPTLIMENINLVTTHIRNKVRRLNKPALHFYRTDEVVNGEKVNYYFENADCFWRLENYVESTTFDICEDLETLRNVGRAFGEFQMQLSDFDASRLHETIPDFHNTKKRIQTLWKNVEEDPCGRVAEVQEELAFVREMEEIASRVTNLQEAGELPLRVTHNDTKTNNVLFDQETMKPLVVIDLDTVMPGLTIHDFGDAVRFTASTAVEDEPNTDKVRIDLEKYRAFAQGFIGKTADSLTQTEIETMALGALTITVELGVRFLNDYIIGDKYFKTKYEGHNLVRARCQFALAKDMHAHLDEMAQIVKEIAESI